MTWKKTSDFNRKSLVTVALCEFNCHAVVWFCDHIFVCDVFVCVSIEIRIRAQSDWVFGIVTVSISCDSRKYRIYCMLLGMLLLPHVIYYYDYCVI